MQSLLNKFCRPALFFLLFFWTSCSQEGVIPKDTMAKIIGEMYLADQFIEQHPNYRAQVDSLLLYESVTQKYGYSFNDYAASVQYYLQRGDALKKIHIKAKDLLQDEKTGINKLLAGRSENHLRWWAVDSIRAYDMQLLQTEPFLRSVRWLSCQNLPFRWQFTDTTQHDIPQNGTWWNNNAVLTLSVPVDTLPVLLRDYLIRKNKNPGHPSMQKSPVKSPGKYDLLLPDKTRIQGQKNKVKIKQ